MFPKKSPLSLETINNKIKALKLMDATQKSIVKARAKEFEEANDVSKYFPSLLGILAFILSLYAMLEKINKIVGLITNLLVITFLTLYSIRLFFKFVERRSTAVYFNALIDSIGK
ncbi:hypothetical protein DN050_10190 [Heyndrickxia coagulans]|nr:hypothetical protein CAY57_10730 [Heyndrickxia coagulans]RCS33552.1 hypothetical protein DN050_10190 [Heyndrickxia coagulans]